MIIIFLKKTIIFLVIALTAAYFLQCVINYGLRKSGYSGDYKEWYEITNAKINADILIQGSSIARIQISPLTLERRFKLSSYNLGISGATFPFEDYKLGQYLTFNRKPKYIIQIVDANTMTHAINVDFVQFIPYLNAKLIDDFKGHILFKKEDLYIPLFRYSHRIGAVTAAMDHLFDKNVQENGNYKGFQTYDKSYDDRSLKKILKSSPKGFVAPYNDTIYREFIDFVKFCKKEDITLIIVYPPAEADFQKRLINMNQVAGWYEKIAATYHLKFLNYSNLPMSYDKSMYFDFFHMNAKGVKYFNGLLIEDLNGIIK